MNTSPRLVLATLLTLLAGCEVPELDVVEGNATSQQSDSPTRDGAQSPPAAPQRPGSQQREVTDQPREATGLDPKKGKLSREQGGYLGSVLGAGMYAQHQAIFLQVKNAINIDYGLHGDFPKSHEEFMERVIKFNNLQLPELDEGDEYLYDPEDHTLKIYRPKPQP